MNNGNQFYYRLDKGPRPYQEDYLTIKTHKNRVLLVVADGMGGHSRGDIASRQVSEVFVSEFQNFNASAAHDILKNALLKAHQKIKESGSDMGTTVVAAILEKKDKEYTLTYTWVGDSRLYVYTPQPHKPSEYAIGLPEDEKGEKKLWLLTRDDSIVWGLYSTGELTLDQISHHPSKNHLQHSIHSKASDFPVRIEEATLKGEDRIFLCTDGVWESFPAHKHLLSVFEKKNIIETRSAFDTTLGMALKNGECTDNNTFILLSATPDIFKVSPPSLKIAEPKKYRINLRLVLQISTILLFAVIFLWFIKSREKAYKVSIETRPKIEGITEKIIIKPIGKSDSTYKPSDKLPAGRYKILIEGNEFMELVIPNKNEKVIINICQVQLKNPDGASVKYSENKAKSNQKDASLIFPLRGTLAAEDKASYMLKVGGKDVEEYDLKECKDKVTVEVSKKTPVPQKSQPQVKREEIKISNSFIYPIDSKKVKKKDAIVFEGFKNSGFTLSIGKGEARNIPWEEFKLVLGTGDSKIEIQRKGTEKPILKISHLPHDATVNIIKEGVATETMTTENGVFTIKEGISKVSIEIKKASKAKKDTKIKVKPDKGVPNNTGGKPSD